MVFLEGCSFQAIEESGHDDVVEDTQLCAALNLLLEPEKAAERAKCLGGLANSGVNFVASTTIIRNIAPQVLNGGNNINGVCLQSKIYSGRSRVGV